MPSILPLAAADPQQVERLLDKAFGAGRHARTAYRIRAGMAPLPDLSFAAFDGPTLLASLQSWPIELRTAAGETHPLILVGPVAVEPALQRGGLGRILMQTMLEAAYAKGEDALVLIGDPEYYGRFFDFTAEETAAWDVPGPVERHRLLARLDSPRLKGLAGMLGPRHD